MDGKSRIRSYEDPCGVARALDAVGERWALLVVRELMFGPKRFGDLRRGLPTVSQNVLSHRLRELAAAGVVARVRFGPPASAWGYELTPRGRELEPVLLQLASWGSRAPMTATGALSADALMFALKTTFDREAAVGVRGAFEVRLGDDRFRVDVGGGGLAVRRGGPGEPDAVFDAVLDAVIEADTATLSAVLFGGMAFDRARHSGALRVTGDAAAAARFTGLFAAPAPA